MAATSFSLKVTVDMGGSLGTWEFKTSEEIMEKADKLIEILGEPQAFCELPGALSQYEMAKELVQ